MAQKEYRKNMLPIDLHVHSTRSDGTFTPAGLVDYAMEKGLAAFALTDHDTVDGLEEAFARAQELEGAAGGEWAGPAVEAFARAQELGDALPLQEERCPSENVSRGRKISVQKKTSVRRDAPLVPEVIPGIELSTEYAAQDVPGQDVHILGLYIDFRNPAFTSRLQEFVDSRILRNKKMCRLLQEAGVPVTYEALLEEFPDAVITRAHYAKYMLGLGCVRTMKEAFDRYVGEGCPCYVPREKVTPAQAVELVLQAGGVPILAHPILCHMTDSQLEKLTAQLTEAGLMGIEAVYSTYDGAEERRIRALAAKYGLLISGGSDFHGANKPGLDLGTGYGKLFLPYSVLTEIKKAAGR